MFAGGGTASSSSTLTWSSLLNTVAGVLSPEVLDKLKVICGKVCEEFQATLTALDGEDDHVHLLVEYSPAGATVQAGQFAERGFVPLVAERATGRGRPLLEGGAMDTVLLRRQLRRGAARGRQAIR